MVTMPKMQRNHAENAAFGSIEPKAHTLTCQESLYNCLVMPTLRSADAQLFYQVTGNGPDVVLLHPFPLNHSFWTPVAEILSTGYRLILPDLRAHGESELGDGPATMQKLADDLALLCREERMQRAFFVGVSIGGYLLFEFWRRHREHVAALVLSNTRAGAETAESKANRLAIAEKVLGEGTAGFIEEMLPKLLSPATRTHRPDMVDAARRMMQKMSADDIAGVQRGMAERPDSVATLQTINVPTLVIAGGDDSVPLAEAELMRQNILASRLQVIANAGHYAALEKPAQFAALLRDFFDGLPRP
jgi:pimeloyl-ACP methyl ester carboxylesterase